jgi:hypothetical protein
VVLYHGSHLHHKTLSPKLKLSSNTLHNQPENHILNLYIMTTDFEHYTFVTNNTNLAGTWTSPLCIQIYFIKCTKITLLIKLWTKFREIEYLDEANLLGIATKALTAAHQTILPDYGVWVATYTATQIHRKHQNTGLTWLLHMIIEQNRLQLVNPNILITQLLIQCQYSLLS